MSILIVASHSNFGERLQAFVRDQLDCVVVGLAQDAAAGLELMQMTFADVALVDIELSGENGFSLVERLEAVHPPVRVMLMGTGDSAEYVEAAARVGAMAYLPKTEISQRLPGLLGVTMTGPNFTETDLARSTSPRGLVLEGVLAGGTLVGGLALHQPLAAMAGAGGVFFFTRWHSSRASRSTRAGGSAPSAASASWSGGLGPSIHADGVRGSPERSVAISDPS